MFLRDLNLRDAVPPAVASSIKWYLAQFIRIAGAGETTPGQQLTASIVVAISLILGTVTSFLAVIPAGTAIIALLRFYPAVNERWKQLMSLFAIDTNLTDRVQNSRLGRRR